MYKDCNVHLLLSNEKPVIQKFGNQLRTSQFKADNLAYWMNLYITDDSEIKGGDWCYDEYNKCIFQNNSKGTPGASKKIIATTDTSLTYSFNQMNKEMKSYRLPQIPKQFIEYYISEYNKGNKIEKVLVEFVPCSTTIKTYSEQIVDDTLKAHVLKLSPANEISIKPVEEKMYTREEVAIKCLQMHNDLNAYIRSCKYGLNTREIAEWNDNWIKENLK